MAHTPLPIEDDRQFLDLVRTEWTRRLRPLVANNEDAEVLCDAVESFLLALRDSHGVSADEVWRALLGGYTEAMTQAYLRTQGLEPMRRA